MPYQISKDMRIARNFLFFVFAFSLFVATTSVSQAMSDGEAYRVKENYRIKRSSDGIVSLYSLNDNGEKEEYVFTEFNADVLLLVYRRIDLNNIVSSMSKKYYMSKTEARRSVKITLNELENWDLIVRK